MKEHSHKENSHHGINILVSPTVEPTTGKGPSCTPAAVVVAMTWVVVLTLRPIATTLVVTVVLVAVGLRKVDRSIVYSSATKSVSVTTKLTHDTMNTICISFQTVLTRQLRINGKERISIVTGRLSILPWSN